jgi:gamma-glutamyltranspeptidase/glutathione hydrolase
MADWFSADKEEEESASKQPQAEDLPFVSRRSPVVCRNGCVASSQPLASSIGVDMLRKGANAADAAIAVAAALCVTEPCSTGLGGDMFCLYYDSASRKVSCINGSGLSPAGLTLEALQRDFPTDGAEEIGVDLEQFKFSAHAVTVPGAAKGYEDLLQRHGSGTFTLADLLEPAAQLAEEGFPVGPVTSHHWRNGMAQIRKWIPEGGEGAPIPLTVDGKHGPKPGDIIHNPNVARVLRDLGANGATKGFYQGFAGRAIVEAVQKHGGTMTLEDLHHQTCSFPEPIAAEYRGVKLWQVPPNGQGVAGLIALCGLQHLEETGACPKITPESIGTADSYHVMMEMTRLGFADGRSYVADTDHVPVSLDWLLDADRIGTRAKELFDPEKAVVAGAPLPSSCTVSFQVVDGDGNAISFVNSNFMGFGTGIVPEGCGFTLQNRGFGFSVEPNHPNIVAPRKRPYHTIIPGMITFSDTNELHSSISNMGGNMQPQGHLQLTVDMIAGGLDPQAAIDLPRFCIADGTKEGTVQLEGGVARKDVEELRRRGHNLHDNVVGHARAIFGRAQIIKRDRNTGVLWAGSDGRADGCAIGY